MYIVHGGRLVGKSLHRGEDSILVVQGLLVTALVDGQVHAGGVVHQDTSGIVFLANKRLDEGPEVGIASQQHLQQGPTSLLVLGL